MAKLVAFYSRADENYFSGGYRYVTVGNTEKVAKAISELTGADLFKIETIRLERQDGSSFLHP